MDLVGKRVEDDDGNRGFVRYVGTVAHSKDPTAIWAGVEWDEPRGKHDGQVEGHRYFQCGANHGSFVRPQKLKTGFPFVQAIRNRYCGQIDEKLESERYLVVQNQHRSYQIQVEFVGQEKALRDLSQIHKLMRVSAEEFPVSHPGQPGEILEHCPNITDLDLSRHLLSSWEDVASIVSQLPRLQIFQLNDSFLPDYIPTPLFSGILTNLVSLTLNRTRSAFSAVVTLAEAQCLPSLKTLELRLNSISQFDSGFTPQRLALAFPHLETLDVSKNSLASFSELFCFSQLPSLTSLLANHNALTHISYPEIESKQEDVKQEDVKQEEDVKQDPLVPFHKLRFLALNDNAVSRIDDLNALASFPALSDLRFQHNPVSDSFGASLLRQWLIARVATLHVLNQSEIRARERANAELFFLKHCVSQYESMNPRPEQPIEEVFPRYAELVRVHGAPVVNEQAGNTRLLDSIMEVSLRSMDPNSITSEPVTKKLPPAMTVGQVKLLLSRLFKLPVEEQVLYYRGPTSDWPEKMEDDLKKLTYYGVQTGGQILMECKSNVISTHE